MSEFYPNNPASPKDQNPNTMDGAISLAYHFRSMQYYTGLLFIILSAPGIFYTCWYGNPLNLLGIAFFGFLAIPCSICAVVFIDLIREGSEAWVPGMMLFSISLIMAGAAAYCVIALANRFGFINLVIFSVCAVILWYGIKMCKGKA